MFKVILILSYFLLDFILFYFSHVIYYKIIVFVSSILLPFLLIASRESTRD
jgi:hypothetical protein